MGKKKKLLLRYLELGNIPEKFEKKFAELIRSTKYLLGKPAKDIKVDVAEQEEPKKESNTKKVSKKPAVKKPATKKTTTTTTKKPATRTRKRRTTKTKTDA